MPESCAPKAPEAPWEPEEPEEPPLRAYRIRVKHRAGPRTRILSLTAESQEEATALAREELEQEWEVLEVSAA